MEHGGWGGVKHMGAFMFMGGCPASFHYVTLSSGTQNLVPWIRLYHKTCDKINKYI